MPIPEPNKLVHRNLTNLTVQNFIETEFSIHSVKIHELNKSSLRNSSERDTQVTTINNIGTNINLYLQRNTRKQSADVKKSA